jgi:hypothetical protein
MRKLRSGHGIRVSLRPDEVIGLGCPTLVTRTQPRGEARCLGAGRDSLVLDLMTACTGLRLSACLTAHNEERNIRKLLRSLLGQK